MKLYICEKPSQGRDYAKALGITGKGNTKGYIDGGDTKITWCIGHLLQPLDPNDYGEEYKKWNLAQLPILPKEKWEYKANPNTKQQLNVVKKLISQADDVYIASDKDREGELIVVSLLEKFKFKGNRYRVLTGALDKVSITKAINKACNASETFNLYLEALSRQKADWIHGMNLTRAMSVANSGKIEGVFSVGRVQTAVLNLIVQRDLEIENFKAKDYFDLTSTFMIDETALRMNWVIPKEYLDEEEKKCFDKSIVDSVIQKIRGKDGKVIKAEKTRKITNAPLLHSLSELQTECSDKFGFPANDTLKYAQSLYETHKATTYPRTDSQYVNNEMFALVQQTVNSMKASDPSNSEFNGFIDNADFSKKTKVWDDKKVEAHHAIIPNIARFDINALSANELKVYDLIRRRFLAQFFPDAESDNTKVEVECEKEIFTASANISVEQGWKEVIGTKSKDKELPPLEKGDDVLDAKPKLEAKKTKPPARFNDGSLIKAMVNAAKYVDDKNSKKLLNGTEGIGTEATRGGIIEILTNRLYTKRNKKDIVSTDKGRALISLVPEESKSIEMTAFWENSLSKISKGALSPDEFLNEQEKILNKMLDDIKSGKCTLDKAVGAIYVCPTCNSGLRQTKKSEKTGKKYWRCLNSESCGAIYADNRGKPLFPKKVDQGSVEYTCEQCKNGKLIRKISQKKVFYWQCNDQDCKQFYSDDNMIPKIYIRETVDQGSVEHTCFKCNKNKLERKKGQYGFYWKCTGSSCGQNFKEKDLKPLKPEPKAKSDFKCPNCKEGYLVQRKSAKGTFFGCNNFPKCKTTKFDKDGKPEGF